MNKNENAQARKVAHDFGMRETQNGSLKKGNDILNFSSTGGSGTYNGGFFNSVSELKKKLNK